jgi:hypothetical protein
LREAYVDVDATFRVSTPPVTLLVLDIEGQSGAVRRVMLNVRGADDLAILGEMDLLSHVRIAQRPAIERTGYIGVRSFSPASRRFSLGTDAPTGCPLE